MRSAICEGGVTLKADIGRKSADLCMFPIEDERRNKCEHFGMSYQDGPRVRHPPWLLTVCVGGSCSEISDPDKNAEDGPSHVPDCVKPCLVDG